MSRHETHSNLSGLALTIESRKAALALLDSSSRVELEVFRQGPLTASQIVRITGQPKYRVQRVIQKWMSLGILVVYDEIPLGKRSLKRYMLVAPQVFIPQDVIPFTEAYTLLSAGLEAAMHSSMEHALLDQTRIEGTLYQLVSEKQQVYPLMSPAAAHDLASSVDCTGIFDIWSNICLSCNDARELRKELENLLMRFRSSKGSQRYFIHLQMVPVASGQDHFVGHGLELLARSS